MIATHFCEQIRLSADRLTGCSLQACHAICAALLIVNISNVSSHLLKLVVKKHHQAEHLYPSLRMFHKPFDTWSMAQSRPYVFPMLVS